MINQKTSIKKIIVKDLKTYWIIPTVGFLVTIYGTWLFLIGLPRKEWGFYGDTEDLMKIDNYWYCILYVALPIIISIAVFRYLYTTEQTNQYGVNSQSGNCKEFYAHTISGCLLAFLPIVLNSIFLIIFSFLFKTVDGKDFISDTDFSVHDVLTFGLMMLLFAFFTYAFATLAGMLSKKIWMHGGLTIFMMILVPQLSTALDGICFQYLDGYCYPSIFSRIDYYFLPESNYKFQDIEYEPYDPIHIDKIVIWLAIAVAIFVLAYCAYKKRNTAKSSLTLTYRMLQPYVTGLCSFIIAVNVIGENFLLSNASYILGIIIGIVIVYILATMLLEQKTNIFNRRIMKHAVIYVVIMGVFAGLVAIDISGFERHIPNEKDIQSVTVKMLYWEGDDDYYVTDKWKFKSQESIEIVRNIHQEIKQYNSQNYAFHEGWKHLGIEYKLNSGKKIKRVYSLTHKNFDKLKSIEKLYKTSEFRKQEKKKK